MGFLDKVKSGAEQAFEKAKDVAQEGYEKAKDEAKELQLKRELGNVHEDLGKKVVELYASGALNHSDLSAGVQRVKEIKDEIDALNAPDPADEEQPAASGTPSA
ncbi:MAG: hypothetical protein R3C15_22850 [Thermoleophilia bacterium]